MKRLIFATVALFLINSAIAQKRQNIYFLKNNGKEMKLRDSADYIRVIEEPDSGETLFDLKEFYQDGTKKLIGKISSFDPKIVYEGTIISYYKNGKRKSAVNYKNDVQLGQAFYFFENGSVKKEMDYLAKDSVFKTTMDVSEARGKLIYQTDSLGNVYVKDGNGHLIETTKTDKDTLIEEGDYKNGFKEGTWIGKYASGKSSYVESYALGKFVAGVTTMGDQTFPYSVYETAPEFKGGINAFYRYLSKSIRYPKDAYKNGVVGSVAIGFVIEKDGQLKDIRINRSVYPSIDQEALRVMSESPAWKPGMQRGVPVRVKYNIPIKFSMK
jgi:TonB family protein